MKPDGDAVRVANELLTELGRAAPYATASTMATQLRMVKGNKAEREVLLDILGVSGVLETPEHTGYFASFVPYAERELPPRHFVDRSYPVCWWRGSHGVNATAVNKSLPSLS